MYIITVIKLWSFWRFRIGQQLLSSKPYYTKVPKYSFSFCSWTIIYLSFGLITLPHAFCRLLSSSPAFAFHCRRKRQYHLSKPQPVWYQFSFIRFISVSFLTLVWQGILSFGLSATQLSFFVFLTLISLFLTDFQCVSSFFHLLLWFALSDPWLRNLRMKPLQP